MILETTIKPRTDGTVIGRMPDNTIYLFKPNDDGVLACEVGNEAHIAWLIDTGYFYPFSIEDFSDAASLVAAGVESMSAENPGDEGVPEADDEGDENAPLIEEPVIQTHRSRKAK